MGFEAERYPIGVFDSGVGGLTVLAALRERLPDESFVYLGDTARLPYGTKSPQTVARYALGAAQVLVDRGVKLLVIACNTASAVAVDQLADHFAPLPVIGVVEPGARAACAASRSGHIAVLATEGTIRGRAYERAIVAERPEARVRGIPCPLFVPLAEEGWVSGDVPRAVADHYLESLTSGPSGVDCIVLGCTHFPVLTDVIRRAAGPGVEIVDSARTTAAEVEQRLAREGLLCPPGGVVEQSFLATDDVERFARVGSIFLAGGLERDDVELVDI